MMLAYAYSCALMGRIISSTGCGAHSINAHVDLAGYPKKRHIGGIRDRIVLCSYKKCEYWAVMSVFNPERVLLDKKVH